MAAIKAELSKKSKYYVEKHRYYELKHFCLQYPFWKSEYLELDGYQKRNEESNERVDPTSRTAELRLIYFDKMQLVEQTAIETDPELATYILKAVTEDLSFNQLHTKHDIPCGRDMYYERYRRFFWLLDRSRY